MNWWVSNSHLKSMKSHNSGVRMKDSDCTISFEPDCNAELNSCGEAADGV